MSKDLSTGFSRAGGVKRHENNRSHDRLNNCGTKPLLWDRFLYPYNGVPNKVLLNCFGFSPG